MNINDIARLANVSKATVSAVINEKPGVAQETRDAVNAIIDKFNYKPNHVARSLSKRATKSIGLIIKEIDNPYYTQIMHGVYNVCSKHGYTVFLGSSELTAAQEERGIEAFIHQQVDGLLVTLLHEPERDYGFLSSLIAKKFPLVLIGGVKNYKTNVVRINNEKAAEDAVSYLIKKGHKRIAYFAGPSNSLNNYNRLVGYKDALKKHKFEFDPELVVRIGSYLEDGHQHGKQVFLDYKKPPTAIFCYNDLVAIGLISGLQEKGIRVPEDVAVLGFDNIEFSRFANIPLSTVVNPAQEIGEQAAELLLKQIKTPDKILFEKIILDAPLVLRKSA